MAIQVQAVITTKGREALAKSFGGALGSFPWSFGSYFKVGVSGYLEIDGQRVPQTPDPSLLDLQSVGEGTFWYRKSFTAEDVLFIAPSGIQFRCFLDIEEGNGEGVSPDTAEGVDGPKNTQSLGGDNVSFFEIAVFDSQGNMVAYGTFPEETKTRSKTLNHLITLNF